MRTHLLVFLALLAFSTTSDAGPAGKTCSKVCRKLTSCRLMSYSPCMDMCARQGAEDTAESRASNLTQANLSCAALADQMAPSKWLCTAEGASSYGRDMDGYTPDVQGTQEIYMLGTGNTRAAAIDKALSDCFDMMTLQLSLQRSMNLDDSAWGAETTSQCHVTQCMPPASRKKSQR